MQLVLQLNKKVKIKIKTNLKVIDIKKQKHGKRTEDGNSKKKLF